MDANLAVGLDRRRLDVGPDPMDRRRLDVEFRSEIPTRRSWDTMGQTLTLTLIGAGIRWVRLGPPRCYCYRAEFQVGSGVHPPTTREGDRARGASPYD